MPARPKDDLSLLQQVLSLPTAPFAEQAVINFVHDFAARSGLTVRADRAGNVIVAPPRRVATRPWVFAAHMDHPGFVATRRRGRTLWAGFRGGVRDEYFRGNAVLFLAPAGLVRAVVKAASQPDKSTAFRTVMLELARPADVPPGTIGMWDVPAFRRRGDHISAPACDDLAGTAAVLAAMRSAARSGHRNAIGLLTRAEEVWFIGAIAACRNRVLPPNSRLLSVETSAQQSGAMLGDGVVVRVGDKASVFDNALTADITSAAEELAKSAPGFAFRRQLMPAGTCESTAYQLWGYRSAAVCVPLGNYHNQGPSGRVAPEQIDRRDWLSLVGLLSALAAGAGQASTAQLKRRLNAAFLRCSPLLRS